MRLEITDLRIRISGSTVVDGVSLTVADGERLALIGESGSGKSLTALAVLGLLPARAEVTGSIRLDGRELVGLPDRELAAIRGRQIGIVFQEPMTALDPIRTVGRQIGDSLRIHYGLSRREVRDRVLAVAERVRLPDPEAVVRCYPHQLSGGQRQRVAIAQAIITGPRLIIADEPTTALDVTVQAGILELFGDLVDTAGVSLVFVTHDLSLLSGVCDDVVVLAEGRIVERGTVGDVVHRPRHPVTRRLVAAARLSSWRAPEGAR